MILLENSLGKKTGLIILLYLLPNQDTAKLNQARSGWLHNHS